MDARQADLLRKIDPAELGQRLRAARVAKGMTQTDLAGAEVSVGYVSRIESGHRRPNLQVLTDLCARLGTPVEQLLMGVAPQELEQIKLNLDFAELSLESGDPQTAELQARDARRGCGGRVPQGARLPGSLPRRPRSRGARPDRRRHHRAGDPAVAARGQRAPDQGRHRPGPVLQRVRRLRQGDRGRRDASSSTWPTPRSTTPTRLSSWLSPSPLRTTSAATSARPCASAARP